MTIDNIINVFNNIRAEYGNNVDIDTVTLLDGDWLAISGMAYNDDDDDEEIEIRVTA